MSVARNANSTLLAPISGVVVPITDVPDPTFAEKMLGDGVAIDPVEETLRAPVAGKVTQLHKSHHALTITTADGVEILMHIGLETVILRGQGFTPLVKEGADVKAGDPLISFDAEYLIHNAASLLTMVVVTAGGGVAGRPASGGIAEAGKTPVLEIRAGEADAAPAAVQGGTAKKSDPILIRNPAGFHARPAAVLVNSAKQFSSDIRLLKGGKEANAKSVVSIMGLEVDNGDAVTVSATGPDADAALAKLVPLILSGLGEDLTGAPVKKAVAPPAAPPRPKSDNPNVLLGVSASPGIVTGQVFKLGSDDIAVDEKGQGADAERTRLLAAVEAGKKQLADLQEELRRKGDKGRAAIFTAHTELLEDPELLDSTLAGVAKGQSAAFAWKASCAAQAEFLSKLGNELLAGRANDIRDVGRRVLGLITGEERKAPTIPANAILIAENLTPSDTAGIDKTKVLGFATVGGSATSHVAILARSASLPAVAAIEERALEIPDNTTVILDGTKGEIHLNPSAADIEKIARLQTELSVRRKVELADAHKPAATTDGRTVKVVANIGGAAEAEEIPDLGGDGVGLLRSEFLFLQRDNAPTIEEQAGVYTTVAKTLGPDRDLVVRTLDVGGDKPLSFLPLPAEENPFLGVRGIRLNLVDDKLLATQVKAVLAAAPLTRLHIMFPMVATVEEFRAAKEVVKREIAAAGVKAPVHIGLMIEVPSAAVLAEGMAKEADFFSIGTNDLTQYTLAVDRGNPRLAKMADGLHPAILKLISMTVEGAHKHGKWVGVCGGLASEPEAVPLLVGLGVDELSVAVAAIPAIKAAVRRQAMSGCRALANRALEAMTAGEVRKMVEEFLESGK